MTFGWINVMGGAIVLAMLLPNVLYALRGQPQPNRAGKLLCAAEQVGRYACMTLMWLPLLVWEFGFRGKGAFLTYAVGNAALLLLYFGVWIAYAGRRTRPKALALAILPTLIFLLSGVLLRHWLLAAAAVWFGVSHTAVTYRNHTPPCT